MSNGASEKMWIVAASETPVQPDRVERGSIPRAAIENIRAVSVSLLNENMEAFFKQLQKIVTPAQEAIGAFELSQVEVTVQVTGEGKVCLLGTGAKMELQGGLKFILKRTPK
ncbi:MAG: hypothetical protein HQ515_05970 [Phycisphaeraceae bacterium]|nr:hypothetical protein [Phycisphaeraceae bacterium]